MNAERDAYYCMGHPRRENNISKKKKKAREIQNDLQT